jgi:hypothetical protein
MPYDVYGLSFAIACVQCAAWFVGDESRLAPVSRRADRADRTRHSTSADDPPASKETTMTFRHVLALGASVCALGFLATAPASALTSKECSAKYQAAKTAGTLGGKTWNDFRKTECGAAPAAPAAEKPAAKPAPAPVTAGNAVFPSKVDPKYANLKPGKARESTCLAQYRANKASGGNGGLRWIQKGGGYYSVCNKRLKG